MHRVRLRPFFFGVAVYLLCVWWLAFVVGSGTDFRQYYALDDTYIHLTIAKNLYLCGSYGIVPHIFSAADSSILWPGLILAFFYFTGVNTLAPLFLTMAVSVLLLLVCQLIFVAAQPQAPAALQTALQLSLVFFVPLTVMPFEGMEHVLQTLACLSFLYLAAVSLAKDHHLKSWRTAALCGLAALCAATRYEGLYLVFIAAALLLWQRRFVQSILIGSSALAPVVAFGMWSQANGSHFVPNSLLLKAMAPGKLNWLAFAFAPNQGIFSRYSWHIGLAEIVIANLAVLVLAIRKQRLVSRTTFYMLLLFLGTAFLHAEFSRLGWVYRYEAYLIALGLFPLFNAAAEIIANHPSHAISVPRALAHPEYLAGAVLLLAIPLIYRAAITIAQVPGAAQAVYFQQYQMGHFLEKYYANTAVAANDIGIIGFLGHPDVLDLFGLSSIEVANLKMKDQYTTAEIARLAREHGVRVAVAYPSWFTGKTELPREWIAVGSWQIPEALFLGGTSVTFYAVVPEEAESLRRNLKAYQTNMPKRIRAD